MNWFKALFNKQEEKPLEIDLDRLENWFSEQTIEKINDFKKDIRNCFSVIETKISDLKTNLKLLEQTEIKDNIEQRIKLTVMGNKEAYVRQAQLFSEQIKIPADISYESSLEYCSNFEEYLKILNEKTAKNHHIIEQLIGEEINKVVISIKDSFDIVKEIKTKLEDQKITIIKNCQKNIKDFRENINISEKAKNKIKETKIKKVEKEIFKKEIIGKISSLEKSEEYKNLKGLKEQKEELIKEIANTETQINQIFIPLERVFKKFQNMNKVQLVEQYLNSPLTTFSQDSNLKIFDYLKEIEGLILKDKIEIKEDKKKEKVLKTLKSLDKSKLENLSNQYAALKFRSGTIKSRIISDNLTEKFMFLNNRLNKIEKEMEELDEKIETIEEIEEKTDIEEKKKQIENLIQNVLNQKIEIK